MSPNTEDPDWQNFLILCHNAKNPKELNELFWLFLTAEERKDIATRYSIVKALIAEEKTQREIAKELGVSIAKITRGSNFLKIVSKKLIARLKT